MISVHSDIPNRLFLSLIEMLESFSKHLIQTWPLYTLTRYHSVQLPQQIMSSKDKFKSVIVLEPTEIEMNYLRQQIKLAEEC